MVANLNLSGVKKKELGYLTSDKYEVEQEKSIFKKMTDWYFEPTDLEKQGKVYELIGMKKFKKGLLKLTSKLGRVKDGTKGSNYYMDDISLESIKRFEKKTRFNETVHVITDMPAIYFAIDQFAKGEYAVGLILSLIALPSLYLAGLQRYNRARIYDIVDRLETSGLDKNIRFKYLK
jgi:hypothetical protein